MEPAPTQSPRRRSALTSPRFDVVLGARVEVIRRRVQRPSPHEHLSPLQFVPIIVTIDSWKRHRLGQRVTPAHVQPSVSNVFQLSCITVWQFRILHLRPSPANGNGTQPGSANESKCSRRPAAETRFQLVVALSETVVWNDDVHRSGPPCFNPSGHVVLGDAAD